MIAYLTPIGFWWGHPPRLWLDPSSDTQSRQRRMSRAATLDGGAVVNDGGYSDADRTFTLVIRHPTEALWTAIEQIAAYASQRVALAHGMYEGRIASYVWNGGETATVVFWVNSKVI